jgi:hypothetical protein
MVREVAVDTALLLQEDTTAPLEGRAVRAEIISNHPRVTKALLPLKAKVPEVSAWLFNTLMRTNADLYLRLVRT